MKKYYIGIDSEGVIVMSDYVGFLRKVELGIANIATLGQKIQYEDLCVNDYNSISFWEVNEEDIINILLIHDKKKYDVITLYDSKCIQPINVSCKHLIVGDNTTLNLDSTRWKISNEVSFLHIRSFKGNIEGTFSEVKKLILFEDNKKRDVNAIIKHFPNIEYLFVCNTCVDYLDISHCKYLTKLEVSLGRNLSSIKFFNEEKIEDIIIQNCKKLVL